MYKRKPIAAVGLHESRIRGGGKIMATSISSRPWLQHYPDGVPTTINYREAPLYSILEDAAAAHPDLPAIRFYGTRLNYGQLWAQAQRFAAVLAELGVRQGD